MSEIVKPIMPEGADKPKTADDEIFAMFRKPEEIIPIPKELADEIREQVLKGGEIDPEKVIKYKVAPKSQQPKQSQPKQRSGEMPRAVAESPWEPDGVEAQRIRRWSHVGIAVLVLSTMASLTWLAMQTGDASPRLAYTVIACCHLSIGGTVLWAWLKR